MDNPETQSTLDIRGRTKRSISLITNSSVTSIDKLNSPDDHLSSTLVLFNSCFLFSSILVRKDTLWLLYPNTQCQNIIT
jgi:hypothetical protein